MTIHVTLLITIQHPIQNNIPQLIYTGQKKCAIVIIPKAKEEGVVMYKFANTLFGDDKTLKYKASKMTMDLEF